MFMEAFRITEGTYDEYVKLTKDANDQVIYPLDDIYGEYLIVKYDTKTHPGNFGNEWDEDLMWTDLADETSFNSEYVFTNSSLNKRQVRFKY